MAKAKADKKQVTEVKILPPNFKTVEFTIRGTTPYVQNAFSAKARGQIKETQEKGSQAKKGRKREPKDFKALMEQGKHISEEGWNGIPAPAFRNAAISACRICGFAMTRAKLTIFVEPDGFDRNDFTPLVKITKGKPIYSEHHVRLETGVCDIRPRPMWGPGWEAKVKIRFDLDQFSVQDVSSLMVRVGLQVGIGEGRPDSKKSCGMGWGMFKVCGK